jgi:spore germination protein GerM
VALAAALLLLAAACGVSTDSKPRPIAGGDVPFGLLERPTTTTTLPPAPSELRSVTVYLLDGGGTLHAVGRSVAPPVTTVAVLDALLSPLTAEDVAAGLTTALAPGTELRGVDGPAGGLLVVDLSSSLLHLDGRHQIQALAQLVFTASELPRVNQVRVEFDGLRHEVPRGDGELVSIPLTRGDYLLQAPPATATTIPGATTTTVKPGG